MRCEPTSRPRWNWTWRVLGCLMVCAGCWTLPSRGAAEQPSEYDVKAAFLLNFVKFVEWPSTAFADSNSPIAICILGRDPFGHVMDDAVQGESVEGRKVTVRRLSEPPASRECQMVFAQGPGKETAKALSALGKGVLTVGEGEIFVRDGGIIGFIIENRRVRFNINQTAASAAGLTLSSKLLSVAKAVE
jgi:YfiR/HmsC-like